MIRIVPIFFILGFLSASIAHSGEVPPAGSGVTARAPLLSMGNLHEFKSRVIHAQPGILVATVDTVVPDAASTIACKSGVARCVIQVEISAQLSADAGETLTICPLVDNNPIDGGCVNQGAVPPYFVYSTMAFVEKAPGTAHSVGFKTRVSGDGGALHRFMARYTSLYK